VGFLIEISLPPFTNNHIANPISPKAIGSANAIFKFETNWEGEFNFNK